jgi:hypothetical protein
LKCSFNASQTSQSMQMKWSRGARVKYEDLVLCHSWSTLAHNNAFLAPTQSARKMAGPCQINYLALQVTARR